MATSTPNVRFPTAITGAVLYGTDGGQRREFELTIEQNVQPSEEEPGACESALVESAQYLWEALEPNPDTTVAERF